MAESTYSISGLASGIDFNTIIDKLIAVEHKAVDVLITRRTSYEDKQKAFRDFNTKLLSFETASDTLRKSATFDAYITSLSSSSSSVKPEDVISISAKTGASAGIFNIKVLNLATAQKISSKGYSDTTTALNTLQPGFTGGKILVGGREVTIASTDSLSDIRDKINAVNSGTSPSRVTATILSVSTTDNRLIITADKTGSDGAGLLQASNDTVIQQLGINGSTTAIKNSITGGAQSDKFSSDINTIKSMLNLSSPQSGTVVIDGVNISIDLNADSLNAIASRINASALGPGTASVVSITEDGLAKYRLQINRTSYTDSNNILQTLGILRGQFATVASQVLTADKANKLASDSSQNITASTTFSNIFNANAANGDTIIISGIDHNGNPVSGSYTITNVATDTVQGLLNAIQTTFNSGVTASIVNGKLTVTDNTAGDSQLSVTLTEKNQGGGTLDFGNILVSTAGSDRELVAPQDATVEVDGISMTRTSNTITDIASGVTVNLLKADSSVTITANVNRDNNAIVSSVQSFVDSYNGVIDFINKQFLVDEKTKKAGVLQGDPILSSIRRAILDVVTRTVSGLSNDQNALSKVGITSDRSAKLSVDATKLREALASNFSNVRALFIAQGTTSDPDVEFVGNTKNSKAGTYNINITSLATQAAKTGTVDLQTNPISAGGETITITDYASGNSAAVSLAQGDQIDTIVSKVNTELNKTVTEVHIGSNRNTTNGTTAITSSTTFSNIFGAGLSAGNSGTITFQGTDRLGGAVSGSYYIADYSVNTVQGLLSAIEYAFSNKVTATIDDGYLVITDKTSGSSSLSFSFTSLPATLDFGTISTSNNSTNMNGAQGRFPFDITASKNGSNNLVITADQYGIGQGFTITSGANKTGTDTSLVKGTDVVGTINGEASTGQGQILTGNTGSTTSVGGLAVKVAGSTTGARGTVTLTLGVAEQLYYKLDFYTQSTTGSVTNKIDGLQKTIDNIQKNIDNMESRLSQKRSQLRNRFVALETTIAKLNSQSQFLALSFTTISSLNK